MVKFMDKEPDIIYGQFEWSVKKARLNKGEITFESTRNVLNRKGQAFFNFNLKSTDSIFEKIIMKDGMPADSDLKAAINRQFNLAMQRDATSAEMVKYFINNFLSVKVSPTNCSLAITSKIAFGNFLDKAIGA